MRGSLVLGALLTYILSVTSQSISDVVCYATYLFLRIRRLRLLTIWILVADNVEQRQPLL